METLHRAESSVTYNCKIKRFPDGSADILCSSRPCFREQGWESDRPRRGRSEPDPEEQAIIDEYAGKIADAMGAPDPLARSKRRAKAAVRDIALCNEFSYFVTLTLDKKRVDRYDMKEITRKLNAWCSNQVQRRGLRYVLVPERHQDGAIHFHGFFNDALAAVDSGVVQGGHRVYNLPAWSLGFTAAIALYGDYHKAVAYVCKYISKAGDKPGGRWYYSGGDLKRPEVELCNADIEELRRADGAYAFTIPEAGSEYVLLRVSPDPGGPGEKSDVD